MRETEQTARTVEEAVEQGLHLLGVTRDQVEVETLEEPSGGLFGLGAKQARVRVMVREVDTDKAREILEGLVKIMKLDALVEVTQADDVVRFDLLGDNLGMLIGHRGQTLNALQFLLGVILTKGMENRRVRCVLDIEGYRVRREKSLQILAERMAKKASMEHRDVVLEPMLPHERRVIHMALEKSPYVTTTSEGKEPGRRVVIKPKEGAAKMGGGRSRSSSRVSNPRGPNLRDPNRKYSSTSSATGSRWGYSRRPGAARPESPGNSDEQPRNI